MARSVVAMALVAACGDDAADRSPLTVGGVEVPVGFDAQVVVDGLGGPTQLVHGSDRAVIVAELNGGEGAGTGRVLRVDLDDTSQREVLVEGLTKPTGVAVIGSELWVMEERTLSVGPLLGAGSRRVVLDDLPYNGRSEGTLTVHPDGGLLYDTSGRRDGDQLDDGSGSLWRLIDAESEPEVIASGLKHAYAHVFDADGQLWSTEMSDGTLDDAVPPDELVLVNDGDDFGYPQCIGDGIPVVELGADADSCTDTPPSHALFPAGATPTSVAVAPWDPEVLLVALWNEGQVVAMPRAPGTEPHRGETFLAGIEHPQHLLADGDRLLVVDFDGGRVIAISPR